jgi:hypothetical protein
MFSATNLAKMSEGCTAKLSSAFGRFFESTKPYARDRPGCAQLSKSAKRKGKQICEPSDRARLRGALDLIIINWELTTHDYRNI